ncbi:hypothetical protein B2J88_49615 [Rhodococcus sp. SRB_17]|nr:hypothetical protein [Rhodococcus sp. SRB_17]
MLAGWAAAYAAVFSFSDLHSNFTIENNRVTYRDGGGSHFDFIALPGGRAAIFGFDRHCPDPALEGGRAFLCDRGAEHWWLETVSNDEVLNFAYGYEAGRWTAVGHDPTRVVPYVLAPGSSQEPNSALSSLADFLEQASEDLLGQSVRGDDTTLRALLNAGSDLDELTLRAALVGDYEYLQDGLEAAALFLPNDTPR